MSRRIAEELASLERKQAFRQNRQLQCTECDIVYRCSAKLHSQPVWFCHHGPIKNPGIKILYKEMPCDECLVRVDPRDEIQFLHNLYQN